MSAQHARLDLALVADAARTRPARALATPPLRISRARYDNPANPAELHLTLTQLGGVLSGDCYNLSVDVGPHAQATLLPAAASQIYTMPAGAAEQHIAVRAAPASRLYWQTAPQILFSGANYRQHIQITLAPDARVIFSDLMVAGRLAHGECWQFIHYANQIEISDQDGQLLAGERIVIEPGRRSPARNGVMGAYPVLGTLWLLGTAFAADMIARRISAAGGPISAAVLPGNCGIVVRMLGTQLAATQHALHCLAAAYADCPLP
jgi:urease accessory protein